jgi:predicted O-linked N-acetylglucosamine transferase (SPINDLY family)
MASYRRALQIKPGFAEVHNSLGSALLQLGRFDEAAASCRRALEIRPDFAEAYNNLGLALHGLARLDDAVASYRRALEIQPHYAEVHNNLGNALRCLSRFDDAVASFRRALEINSEFAEAHSNLGIVLINLGQMDDAVASYRRALKIKPDVAMTHSSLLFALQFTSAITSQDLFEAHKRFGEQYEAPLKPHWPAHANSREPDKRLKIGYVSGDFREHAVAYFIEPVLSNHDKTQVEVFCYANSPIQDAVTVRLMAAADRWLPCAGMTDDELAQRIRADGIDILVDLCGHTAYNRLLTFARKPAPIQITYLGYPGGSGLSAMDYRLTDRYAEPGDDQYYTEELLRLPDSLWCYRPADGMPEATPLPALANGYLTFGSFNNCYKVGEACIALWAALLRSLPTARLLMVTVPEGEMRLRLTRQFEEFGVASERLAFCGKLPAREFHRKLQQVDIALDPFPVNGATTTCESLWLGVPVLTLVGGRFLSRAGFSVLNAAGLPEFAAATPEEYIQAATKLANDLPRLAEIRAGMRAHLKTTPLLDQQRFTRNLESIYRDVWRWYAAG